MPVLQSEQPEASLKDLFGNAERIDSVALLPTTHNAGMQDAQMQQGESRICAKKEGIFLLQNTASEPQP